MTFCSVQPIILAMGLVAVAAMSGHAATPKAAAAQMAPSPVYSYHLPFAAGLEPYGSPVRVVKFGGRSGLNFTGIRGRLALANHTVDRPAGTVTMWVAPLQELSPAIERPNMAISNSGFGTFPLLTDREAVREYDQANFAITYLTAGQPGTLWAKFSHGSFISVYDAAHPGAMVTTNGVKFPARQWYQITATWDRPKSDFRLYVNGVLVGIRDQMAKKVFDDPCGPILYLGNPALAYSDIAFYDRPLDRTQISALFHKETTGFDPAFQATLEKEQDGKGLPRFDWKPDADWITRLDLHLNSKADFQKFSVQGYGNGVEVTPEGFHIRTPSMEEANKSTGIGHVWTDLPGSSPQDMTRMYLWTRAMFEGDLYVSMDLKIIAHGGLSLLMFQAAGMQGEDFMTDYFLRTNGSMVTVGHEDVRNYDWEYYREMVDIRNDHAAHYWGKNPWGKTFGSQMENRSWDLDRWYHIEFLQQGGHLRGVIDGVTVLDAIDDGMGQFGPVLTNGHVAIRFMMRTNVVIRNLKVMNRPLFESTPLKGVGSSSDAAVAN